MLEQHLQQEPQDGTKRYLTAEQILATPDLEIRDVWVPHWGGHVPVRSLTGRERDAFEISMTKEEPQRGKRKPKQKKNLDNLRARLIALTALKEDRVTPLFTPQQVLALGAKNAAALNVLFAAAMELSGLDEDDVDDMLGNSEEEDGTSSSSDLPVT